MELYYYEVLILSIKYYDFRLNYYNLKLYAINPQATTKIRKQIYS